VNIALSEKNKEAILYVMPSKFDALLKLLREARELLIKSG